MLAPGHRYCLHPHADVPLLSIGVRGCTDTAAVFQYDMCLQIPACTQGELEDPQNFLLGRQPHVPVNNENSVMGMNATHVYPHASKTRPCMGHGWNRPCERGPAKTYLLDPTHRLPPH